SAPRPPSSRWPLWEGVRPIARGWIDRGGIAGSSGGNRAAVPAGPPAPADPESTQTAAWKSQPLGRHFEPLPLSGCADESRRQCPVGPRPVFPAVLSGNGPDSAKNRLLPRSAPIPPRSTSEDRASLDIPWW